MSSNKNRANLICENCMKKFKSIQGLIRHQSRKVSCIEILECEKCHKVFDFKYNLNRHLARKTSCVKQNLSLQRSVEDEIKIIECKKNADLEKLEKKKEIIQAQKEKDLAIEEKKLERKKQTSHITIINNIANQVNINLPATNRISATYSNCIEDIVKPFIKQINSGSYNSYKLVYESGLNKSEIATTLIQSIFNNDDAPTNQNIVYITEQDLFMVALHKAWVHKQFDYIGNIMTETFKQCFSAIKNRIGEPIKSNFISNKAYEKALLQYEYVDELSKINISPEELENSSRDGLNIDDILTGKRMIKL